MIRVIAIVALGLLLTPAAAQQAPDATFMQKAILVLQQQRNAAADREAQAQAQSAVLADENAQLKARIAELEKAAPASAEPSK